MKKQTIASVAILMVLMFSMFAVLTPRVHSDGGINFVLGKSSKLVGDDPVYAQQLTSAELDAVPAGDPTPFNVAMVGADKTTYDGTGIYVAVLDTGLLSNWQTFFPPGTVNIDTADGIGYTHDVFFVGSGGNFSDDGHFSYGPLLNTRGFITHDNGAPDALGAGYGSGHGTHVTSIITGYQFTRGSVSAWIRGVAPKVTIIPVLVLDDWVVPDHIDGVLQALRGRH